MFDERILQVGQPAIRGAQAFDGDDPAALGLMRQRQAAQHRLIIEQHRTRAALAAVAALFGRKHPETVAQHGEQTQPHRYLGAHRLAVEGEAKPLRGA